MQFRNISPLQLPGERSMQENQTKQLIVLLILLSLSFKDAPWDPHTVSLCWASASYPLNIPEPQGWGPCIFEGSVIYYESSHEERGLECSALTADIWVQSMYCVPVVVPAWRVIKLLEITKASVEHSAAFTEGIIKRSERTGASAVTLWSWQWI